MVAAATFTFLKQKYRITIFFTINSYIFNFVLDSRAVFSGVGYYYSSKNKLNNKRASKNTKI